MTLPIVFAILSFTTLVIFAIHRKDSVKASIRIPWFGFSLEAKNGVPDAKKDEVA